MPLLDTLALLPSLGQGLLITLQVFGGALLVAIPLAVVAGLSRMAPWGLVSWPAAIYIEVFRGTSALVQLFWFYYVLPLFGLSMPALLAGMLVLGLNSGAYGAEVVRGAVRAVPEGQREAALALNLGRAQTLRRIVLPQAVAAMLPPTGNLLIELLKNTALVSLITIADLTFRAQLLRSDTLRTLEIFTLVLLLYFAVALLITAVVRGLERWLRVRRGERP